MTRDPFVALLVGMFVGAALALGSILHAERKLPHLLDSTEKMQQQAETQDIQCRQIIASIDSQLVKLRHNGRLK